MFRYEMERERNDYYAVSLNALYVCSHSKRIPSMKLGQYGTIIEWIDERVK